MPEVSIAELLLVALALMAAGLVHGTLGIGFPLVSTPLLATVFDVRVAILITLVPTVAVNCVSILREVQWARNLRDFLPMALCCFAGGLLGAYALVVLDPAPFRLVLAAIIALYLYGDSLRVLHWDWLLTHRTAGMLLVGLLAGLSAGAVNVMVPILVIYALASGVQRHTMIAVFNLCFLAGKLAQITMLGGAGLLDAQLLWITAPGAVLAVVALLGGMRIRRRISTDAYVCWLRRLLLVSCVVLVIEYLLEVWPSTA